jgi:hypothetical protein
MMDLGTDLQMECFSRLLDDPQACRMLGDVEVQDAPTIMTD